MKLRMLAMATVAAAALSTPAMAGDGWYLGIGGGWDNQLGYNARSNGATTGAATKINSKDSAIGMLSIGYKWAEGWRLENELAFTQHDTSLGGTGAFNATGGNQITSDMINLTYDFPLGDMWKLTVGGGVGIGGYRGSLRSVGTTFDLYRGGQSAFQ